jgi:hypothetical protein
MQLWPEVTPVLGTYRDCGIFGLLSSLLGKILNLRFRSLLIEFGSRIRVFPHGQNCPALADGMRLRRQGSLDE